MSIFNGNLILKTLIVGSMSVNCYIISNKLTNEAFLIDPGDDFVDIKKYLDVNKLEPRFIVHTHGHYDHIGADNDFNLPIYIHNLDKECLVDAQKNLSGFFDYPFILAGKRINTLEDNSEIKFADSILKITHTPGHSAGGICILLGGALFSGDTLFAQGIGRTDFPGACHETLIKSIKEKIFTLNDNIVVYPGHGPATTIGREKATNLFLN